MIPTTNNWKERQTEHLCTSWVTCGKKTPRSEVVFVCQVLILYTVIVVSIYNLTVESENSTLWTALLSSCLGYLLPNPTIKTKHVLLDSFLRLFLPPVRFSI
jgi:hypothetical protein